MYSDVEPGSHFSWVAIPAADPLGNLISIKVYTDRR
jgi:hypothetical protein